MIGKPLLLVPLSLLVACAPTKDAVKTTPVKFDSNVNTVIWVDQFRNTATIEFEVIERESSKRYQVGTLQNGNLFRPAIKHIGVKLPTEREFNLRFEFTSSSSAVTKRCTGSAPMVLEAGVNYDIEFVNWLPKDAMFANFSCQIKWSKVDSNGTKTLIGHFKKI